MNFIITETQYNKFVKSSPKLEEEIIKYLNRFISKGYRKIGKKSHNYGNLREEWCIDGNDKIIAIYYFDDDKFTESVLLVSENLIDMMQSLFTVRKSFIIHVIENWYDDVMVPKFEEITGERGLYISDIDTMTESPCIPESVLPEGITDEEMINFIDKNTAYSRQEILDKTNSGERDLEDFYLDVADTVKRKEIRRF